MNRNVELIEKRSRSNVKLLWKLIKLTRALPVECSRTAPELLLNCSGTELSSSSGVPEQIVKNSDLN